MGENMAKEIKLAQLQKDGGAIRIEIDRRKL
jgi:hypothetical protein